MKAKATFAGDNLSAVTPLVFSSFIIPGNLGICGLNTLQICKKEKQEKIYPILGLCSGTFQVYLGALTFPGNNNRFDSDKTLAIVDIGIGTTTIITSAWNLISNRKRKEKKVSWNIYSFPLQGKIGIGFSLSKSI